MGLVERWNKLAKKNLYINGSWEIPVGRLMYFVILNGFISLGMMLSGTTTASLVWLWVDLIGSFNRKGKVKDEEDD